MNKPNKKIKLSLLDKIKHNVSTLLMDIGRGQLSTIPSTDYKHIGYDGGTAQRTYFMDRDSQKRIFLRDGYIEDTSKNYGLVKKAVNNRNIPIYQRAPDDEKRENLIPIGNVYNYWYGKPEADLIHAGSYPTAIYINPNTKKIYQKAWDLNDYGDSAGGNGASSKYTGFRKFKANLSDKLGSPVVVTSGISEVGDINALYKRSDTKDIIKMVDDFYESKGLKRFTNVKEEQLNDISGKPMIDINGKPIIFESSYQDYALPEVIITGKRKRKTLSGKY
ncbi:hypothetical protein KNV45_gp16 [uncultured phage cr271_1]|uniref:Uncharacterized protein n=1 Tax=uncultured phage cr271_1 TaxID=2772078 RepID=A0A7M1RZX9_9CAUD|nr:hypothetical protein KNV45_gp16 [uncultured phage cr271_1]QOR59836.1 hypothetical protein [uncultured phage cr271_1]